MPSIHLRPYQDRDLDAVVRLWYQTWHAAFPDLKHPDALPVWRDRFVQELQPQGSVWVAVHTACLIGFVVVIVADNYLDQLFVDAAYHGQGIGRALLNKAKTLCPLGLTLHTLQRNMQARTFYEREGFRAEHQSLNPVNGQPNISYHWTGDL